MDKACDARRSLAVVMHLRSSQFLTNLVCFTTLCLLVGCASAGNLARYESATCEVHNCAMTIQEVECYPGGFSGYLPQFSSAMRHQFPHHGRIHYSEDHGYLYARHLRTYVCPECTKAYDQWIAEHKMSQEIGPERRKT
jgi:hypothetical protein